MKGGGKSILLVTGACRSGKSRFAQEWAEGFPPPRLFLATAQTLDEEMAERVRRHREARGQGWRTEEEPLDPEGVMGEWGGKVSVLLLDCLTLWISNLMMAGLEDPEILARGESLAAAAARVPCPVVLVTNEVGWGIVPDNPMGRRFRDLAGSVNQQLAGVSDRVVLMVAGMPVAVKG